MVAFTDKAQLRKLFDLKGKSNSICILLIWLIVDAISGWFSEQVIRGYDLGLVRNIIVGLVGVEVGGYLLGQLGIAHLSQLLGDIIVAFCGAAMLLVVNDLGIES